MVKEHNPSESMTQLLELSTFMDQAESSTLAQLISLANEQKQVNFHQAEGNSLFAVLCGS